MNLKIKCTNNPANSNTQKNKNKSAVIYRKVMDTNCHYCIKGKKQQQQSCYRSAAHLHALCLYSFISMFKIKCLFNICRTVTMKKTKKALDAQLPALKCVLRTCLQVYLPLSRPFWRQGHPRPPRSRFRWWWWTEYPGPPGQGQQAGPGCSGPLGLQSVRGGAAMCTISNMQENIYIYLSEMKRDWGSLCTTE